MANKPKILKQIIVFVFFLLIISLLFPASINAQEPVVPGTATCNCSNAACSTPAASQDDCTKYCCGDYTLNDFIRLAVQVSKIILGIVGSLSLLAFVVGGVMFLISAGSSDRIAQAKRILSGAVIGLVVVLGSYTIVYFVATTILGIPATSVFTSGQF